MKLNEQQSLYHVVPADYWSSFGNSRLYQSKNFEIHGFIHLCLYSQLKGVLQRYFQGSEDLLVLQIERKCLDIDVIFEDLLGKGEEFPHLYGPLNIAAVRKVVKLQDCFDEQ